MIRRPAGLMAALVATLAAPAFAAEAPKPPPPAKPAAPATPAAAPATPAAAPATPAAAPAAPAVTPAPAAAVAPAPATLSAEEREKLREEVRREVLKEVEDKLDTAREELRDEVRAVMTTANATSDWSDETFDQQLAPKLEFFEPHGYFRVRMDLFENFDLGVGADPSGHFLFPVDPLDPKSDSLASANLRLRFEPTLNISEDIRIKFQIDALDNIVLGSTPEGGFDAASGSLGTPQIVFSQAQLPPHVGVNAITDSIEVKRAWAEVRTPVGELRFGRMGSQWGLGILSNDGNCLDCDAGDTVDRILFATKIADHIIAPGFDFVSEGATSADPYNPFPTAQPFDRTQLDDARNYVLAIARRDKDDEIKRRRVAGEEFFLNYGMYFVYREQAWDAPQSMVYGPNHANAGGGADLYETRPETDTGALRGGSNEFVPRDAWAVIPDVWVRVLYKAWRMELELVTIQGKVGNRSVLDQPSALDPAQGQSLTIEQYAGVIQNELKLLDDKLAVGLEIGFASGDSAPGFGNQPGRIDANSDSNPFPQKGDWEGQQFKCTQAACEDDTIQNFRFDKDYRVDMILFRELIGGVTDTTYFKPNVKYDVTEGLSLSLAAVFSVVNEIDSTPTGSRPLGLELDGGVRYASDDGFIAGVQYGVLFPLDGLGMPVQDPKPNDPEIYVPEIAQAIRGVFGVQY